VQAPTQLNNQLKIKQLKQTIVAYKKAAKFCFNKKNYVEFGISEYTVEQILSL
jgi:hypothetical protein